MNEAFEFDRSNLLLSRSDSALLIVDAQEKFLSVIPNQKQLRWNLKRLADGAEILDVPVLATEQYPEKLGKIPSELTTRVATTVSKMTFSCCGEPNFMAQLKQQNVSKILVAGIEAHVCILQTVFDLLSAGYEVYVVVDAIAARFEIDYKTALQRMSDSGVTLISTEMALFEWCERAGTSEFKQLSKQVVKTTPSNE